jgi:O-methyltransferase
MASNFLLRSTKSIFFKTPLWRYFQPVMKFDMSIVQLQFITQTLVSIEKEGAVVEIGVGGGATSIMINQFMAQNKINREFHAIDTFFGFTKEDIQYEKKNRGKEDNYLYYRSNKKEWYEKCLKANGINNAKVYKEDAKKFDYSIIGPLAFCLFDVDLFLPTEYVLPKLYDILVPGGVIIVDDCSPALSIYDGAGEAYRKFCDARGLEQQVVHEKLGVIRKPLA